MYIMVNLLARPAISCKKQQHAKLREKGAWSPYRMQQTKAFLLPSCCFCFCSIFTRKRGLTGILISPHIYGQKKCGSRNGLSCASRSSGRVFNAQLCPLLWYLFLLRDQDTHSDRVFSFVVCVCNTLNENSIFVVLVSSMPLALVSWVWICWLDVLCVLGSMWSTSIEKIRAWNTNVAKPPPMPNGCEFDFSPEQLIILILH